MPVSHKIAVMISANQEWDAVRAFFPDVEPEASPLGAWFVEEIVAGGQPEPVIFFHGGWGKVRAAASTQHVIDRWRPEILVNLGTCGGFEGAVTKGEVILATRTVIYDIMDLMGDNPQSAVARYATDIDLSWLGQLPDDVTPTVLVSADRDLRPEDLSHLRQQYGAVAGDWESGAIAYITARNSVRCLILRGVSDIVGVDGGEAYENIDNFAAGAHEVMKTLLDALPWWVSKIVHGSEK